MPTRRLPNTTPGVLRTLRRAREAWQNTALPADRAISAEQWAQLDPAATPASLLTRFEKEVSDVDLALAAQAPLTSQHALLAAQLTTVVSHFHQVLDLAIVRGQWPPALRAYYGRDVELGLLPPLSSYEEVEEAAEAIVAGETARATAEGAQHLPMSMPRASDVSSLLQASRSARTTAGVAMGLTNREREEVQTLYPAAQELAVDVCDTVEFFFRRDPLPGSRRTKCKRWGVVYLYAPGEPADPEPAPTPEPPTPPVP
jgi:hypothetical protein